MLNKCVYNVPMKVNIGSDNADFSLDRLIVVYLFVRDERFKIRLPYDINLSEKYNLKNLTYKRNGYIHTVIMINNANDIKIK